MSIRTILQNGLPPKILAGVDNATYSNGSWVRNPSWLPLASITSNDQKFTGLYQINRYANFIALNFTTSGGAQYTVDWGDGSVPVNVNSATQAQYEYDWNNANLTGTDAPVTFNATTNTVNRNNHGYTNGMNISFATIVTTTGIEAEQNYYVVNQTTNSFQLSNTINGAPITFTNNGSGTILPYKQVVVTVTPVSGNFTAGSLNAKHTQPNLGLFITGWLDVAFAGNFTSIGCRGTAGGVLLSLLQRVNILNSSLTSYANLFQDCISLINVVDVNSRAVVTSTNSMFQSCINLLTVPIFNMATVTSMSNMFASCFSLETIPLLNTSNVTDMQTTFQQCQALSSIAPINTSKVTNMLGTFGTCTSLPTIPLLNTSNVTNMNVMFQSCTLLNSVPPLDMSKVTNTAQMFQGCSNLQNVGLINTSAVLNASQMFISCVSLTTIPLLNTSNVTNMSSMFQGCTALTTIPLIDTNKVTTMQSMFQSCASLKKIPLLNTINVLNMISMFQGCTALTTIPLLNTSNVTNMTSMFNSSTSLQQIPLINTSNVTTVNSMFNGATALKTIPQINISKVTDMGAMFNGCQSLQFVPQLDTANVTSMSSTFAGCRRLTTVPLLNTIRVTNFDNLFSTDNCIISFPKFNTANVTTASNMLFISGLGINLPSLREIPAVNSRFLGAFPFRATITRYQANKLIQSFSIAANLSGQALNEIYTNLMSVGGSVTFQALPDTVTIVNHGYVEGDPIRFSVITTTTGISINTTYIVRNPTTDTFQLSATATGAIINLVNDGTGTRAPATITVTGNFGTATDDPTIATNKGWTVTGS